MSKVIKNHYFDLPLDYSNSKSEKIQVFVREISRNKNNKLPYLLYLQGGPGYESPRSITNLKFKLKHADVELMDFDGPPLGAYEFLGPNYPSGPIAKDQAFDQQHISFHFWINLFA